MNRQDVQNTTQRVFREVFDEAEFEYARDLSRDSLTAWDSLGHIRLVAALEEAFELSFTIEEIEGFTSAGLIEACVLSRNSEPEIAGAAAGKPGY